MRHALKIITLMITLFVGASSFAAMSVQDAKKSSEVVESTTGYLVAKTNASDDAKKLVKDINAKRKKLYSEIAKKRNVPLEHVEKAAGKKHTAKK